MPSTPLYRSLGRPLVTGTIAAPMLGENRSGQKTPVAESGPRVGLTVGKVMGKAVDRNRIKRRLREVIRRNAQLLRLLPVDVILHPRRAVIDLDFEVLDREVAGVFRTIQRTVQNRSAKEQRAVAASPAATLSPADE